MIPVIPLDIDWLQHSSFPVLVWPTVSQVKYPFPVLPEDLVLYLWKALDASLTKDRRETAPCSPPFHLLIHWRKRATPTDSFAKIKRGVERDLRYSTVMFALRMVVKCHKAFKNKRNWLTMLLQISRHGLVSFTTSFSSEFNSSVPWHQQIILCYYCLNRNNLVLMWGAALTKTAQCNASLQSQFYQCTQILICKHSDYSSAGLQLSRPPNTAWCRTEPPIS